MSTDTIPVRPNGHDTNHGRSTVATETCPYCGGPLTAKFHREIRQRLEQEEAARLARHEEQMRAGFERESARLEKLAAAAIEKATRDAGKAAEKKLALLRSNQEAVITARVTKEREKTSKAVAAAIEATKIEHSAERVRLEGVVNDLQRRLAAKPAHAIGLPAEIDLHQQISMMLTASALEDRASRVAPGVEGADVVVEVVHRGESCGRLIIESKNHKTWKSSFTRRLRENQVRAGASFAILSSPIFWSGAPPFIALRDGVICAKPEAVPTLVLILRQIVADDHVRTLSTQARDEKAEKALAFLTSPTCNDLFAGWHRLTRDLYAVDQAERMAHEKTWERRSKLVEAVDALREQFVSTVADIVSGDDR